MTPKIRAFAGGGFISAAFVRERARDALLRKFTWADYEHQSLIPLTHTEVMKHLSLSGESTSNPEPVTREPSRLQVRLGCRA